MTLDFTKSSNLLKNMEITNIYLLEFIQFLEYHTIKHFTAFGRFYKFFDRKKVKNTFLFKNGLTTCYL